MDNETADQDQGAVSRLPADRLRRFCDPDKFGFKTTSEIADIQGLAGQSRVFDAVDFGSRIARRGYNLFVIGPPGSGKHTGVRGFLEAKAAEEPTPSDWVYVNNFKTPHRPTAIELPPGRATQLSEAMEELIEELRAGLPAIFEGEDYQNRRSGIDEVFQARQEEALEVLGKEAQGEGVAILRSPQGFAMAPAPEGQVIKPDEFNALSKAEKERYETTIKALQEKLGAILKSIPRWDKDRRDALRTLNREVAGAVVAHSIKAVKGAFAEIAGVVDYLDILGADLVENAPLFIAREDEQSPFGTVGAADARFDRYRVNPLVARETAEADAPVITEDHPTLGNLIGRVEHLQQQGALVTNFMLIKAGSLHQANGGYLLIDARAILTEPLSWQALKRSLRNESIRIESPGEYLGLVHTISLDPDPVPLDVKVVLFGDRQLYYLLSSLDPDVAELFKVVADYDDDIGWDQGGEELYAGLIASVVRRENLRPLDAQAVGRTIGHAARLAEDAQKLSLAIAPLADLLREADHWAGTEAADTITAAHVQRAIDEQLHRTDRIRQRSQEMILREIALIDTSGEAVGQINGLSVVSLGQGTFGRPSRITARVRVGTGRVVDIEREVELGGPLHSKGVLILSGFLQSHYALDAPMSLAASLVFEQSYGGVDGDSASSTELYAILSALAEVPIRQSFAVTGSVNQQGQVQAIGGVNHKIEGYFDICVKRGLTGEQGVLVPISNVQHLMLRDDVIEACAAGKFHVHAVSTINQGIEILTGRQAGDRGADGLYPEGSINRLVEDRLIEFAKSRRGFAAMNNQAAGGSDPEQHR